MSIVTDRLKDECVKSLERTDQDTLAMLVGVEEGMMKIDFK